MDLLYMPLLDLQQHLKQELLANPFLELEEPEEENEVELKDETGSKEEERDADEPDWESILLDDGPEGAGLSRDFSEAREYVEPVPVEAKDLSDHLQEQVQMLDLTPRQRLLAEEFLGNIAEDGYLGASLEDIVAGVNKVLEAHAARSAPDTEADLEAAAEFGADVAAEAEPEPVAAAVTAIPFYTLAEAETMLQLIQKLDPPG